MITQITPSDRAGFLEAEWIDVREYPEFAAASITGSKLVPLARVAQECRGWDRGKKYVVLCKSGQRSLKAARLLEEAGFRDVCVLGGGIEAWMQAGCPVEAAVKQPWSLERQVRFAAGILVLISAILGLTFSAWFFGLTFFVGAGLVFAAVSNTCMMASLLGRMPWNRVQASSVSCAR